MNYTICSRESISDYAWDNTHASLLLGKYARDIFAPAFEGSLTESRFIVLLRSSNISNNLVVGVSVSTTRKDSNRPIRTLAFLEATDSEEERILASFFVECLCKPDTGTIYDAESPVAKAVESIYQKKNLDEFLAFCRTLSVPTFAGEVPKRRMEFPRADMTSREDVAKSISELIRRDLPFLITLTDRATNDVLKTLRTIFNGGVVRIFSIQTLSTKNIPLDIGALQKYIWAAAIGGIALIILIVAAIRSCSRERGNDSAAEKGATVIETNAVPRTGAVKRSSVID